LLALIGALFAEPNPACIKSALAQGGLIDNSLRAPMLEARKPFDATLWPSRQ
jgi:dihydrodipicolinate synthase/N-acetylneuraminate lyase